MDIRNQNDFNNVSRPKDGKISLPEGFSFEIKQTSKTENFRALEQVIREALQKDKTIDAQAIEHFFNDIVNKSTTKMELMQGITIAKQLSKHPEKLSEASQSLFMDNIQKIKNHRNADYSITNAVKEIFSELSRQFPKITSNEAQKKFFDNVSNFAPFDKNANWKLEITANIATANRNGISDIAEISRNQYVNLFGSTAAQVSLMDSRSQSHFSNAAMDLMRKTKFPYKFDAASFREALFSVPDNIRTEEYMEQLAKFEENISLFQTDTVSNEASPSHHCKSTLISLKETLEESILRDSEIPENETAENQRSKENDTELTKIFEYDSIPVDISSINQVSYGDEAKNEHTLGQCYHIIGIPNVSNNIKHSSKMKDDELQPEEISTIFQAE